jgi:UDP-glucose 4-epimerase
VPTLFDRASDGRTFEIWGDGSIVRDYCYIDDLVEAIVLAIGAEATEAFRVYNVASGATASILQLVDACAQASGRSIQTAFRPARGVDVARVSPLSQRIGDELGWKARVDLATGLQRTWSWHQQVKGSG